MLPGGYVSCSHRWLLEDALTSSASCTIIERCGVVLEEEYHSEPFGCLVRRYRIRLRTSPREWRRKRAWSILTLKLVLTPLLIAVASFASDGGEVSWVDSSLGCRPFIRVRTARPGVLRVVHHR